MVTHNLRYAVEYGNRLLMMNKGEAAIDAQDAEKDKLEINDLVQVFSEISIELETRFCWLSRVFLPKPAFFL